MRSKVLYITFFLLVATLLAACDVHPSTILGTSPSTADPVNSTESTKPVVEEGTLLTDLLEVVSWNDQRTIDSSFLVISESETGLYMQRSRLLYYADKSNPGIWVPLCSKPDCDHPQEIVVDPETEEVIGCDANIGNSFYVKEDRIYFLTSDPDVSIPKQNLVYPYVGSMALDGTDRKMEYYHKSLEEHVRTYGGGGNWLLTPDCYFTYLCSMTKEGSYTYTVYVKDETGEYEIFCGEGDSQITYSPWVNGWERLYGDMCFYIPDIDGSYTIAYRLKDRQIYRTELADLPITGGYLEDNNLRCFYPNDGYYDVDLTTRERTHLADAQLENSQAFIMQYNCILETTLTKDREPGSVDTHQLRFFDGQQWHEVTLPEELAQVADGVYLWPRGLTSDRLVIEVKDPEYKSENPQVYGKYYQILLGEDTYTLEHMVTFE